MDVFEAIDMDVPSGLLPIVSVEVTVKINGKNAKSIDLRIKGCLEGELNYLTSLFQ